MDVVRHGVTLDKLNFLVATQLTDNLANLSSKSAVKNLLTVFGHDYNMIFALPFYMG